MSEKCVYCGSEVDDNAVVCPRCGAKLKETVSNSDPIMETNTNHVADNYGQGPSSSDLNGYSTPYENSNVNQNSYQGGYSNPNMNQGSYQGGYSNPNMNQGSYQGGYSNSNMNQGPYQGEYNQNQYQSPYGNQNMNQGQYNPNMMNANMNSVSNEEDKDGHTAMILGILGLLCCSICSVVAIVMAVKSKNNLGYYTNQAKAGLIMGIIGCAFTILNLVLSSINTRNFYN